MLTNPTRRLFALRGLLASSIVCFAMVSKAQTPITSTCSNGFVEAYRRMVVDIKTIGVFVKQNRVPPNLARAVRSCNKLENAYPNYSCEVGTQTATSSDMQAPCQQIRALALKLGVQVPADVPPPTAAQITDDTPVANLHVSGVLLRVNNPQEFARAEAAPKTLFFINGQIYDFISALTVSSPVRCTLDLAAARLKNPQAAGQVLRSSYVQEDYGHENFVTTLVFNGANFSIECSRQKFGASALGTGVTYGELKAAFGAIATFDYQPPAAAVPLFMTEPPANSSGGL